ncbi:tRNA synthetases class I-domain-containing protein [Ochromonadaceae sp. CCMP2298]|nr:tRNA synthetases class I-domain-containing protein [Ochromonadaceae sp. CCMP2298]|mmetsp:Transcript_33629/g.74127  ORF Transcript_33629/g.74127 Transcript_33629/m.74127 type:complete len:1062 (-) Transcript_33629:94-3279(-)
MERLTLHEPGSMKLFSGRIIGLFLLSMYACLLKGGRAFRQPYSFAALKSRYSPAGNFVAFSSNSDEAPAGKKERKKAPSRYASTVLLPVTSFDQRANAVKKEPEMQKWWADNQIYEKLSKSNPGEDFILHDGPPYANGDLHIGHALNKILKDFINKYQILKGRKVNYIPGWDCHGLPIELKVLQSMKQKEREALTPVMLRKRAAEFAKEAVEKQRESFKRYGVWGDWDKPYMTLQPEYEAAQIRVFGEMVTRGHIYRGKKPVHWSPSSRTALAEAELEYPENHISKSIYVAFTATKLSEKLAATGLQPADVRIAIWTTTPWTIPSNLAVAVNAQIDYLAVSCPSVQNGAKFLVAKGLEGSLANKMGLDASAGQVLEVFAEFKGEDLVGTLYQHPLYDRQSEVVLGGDYINTDSGTGLVHTAPGHGQEDYLTGLKYGLPLLSPVNDLGRYTDEVGERFAGMDVLGDGNIAIIEALKETGCLIKQEDYNHKYPYDWRTKKPTIFRATEQWFASVSTFRQNALDEIEKVQWIPAVGKNRIISMTESRGDWCISRQRSWGVPIPVFYKRSNNEPLMTPETLSHIEQLFRERGSDSWWELETADLLPPSLRDSAEDYAKGTDTMDVWFDSGTSWAGVVQERDELRYPADVYLEGSDQHRGWFQSSLLTSVASQGVAPYKTVLTHGFVLDEKGYKMSKSLGNVVDPKKIIEGGSNQKEDPAYGADTLRLWVSGVDYSGDVCLGANIMKQVSEASRKIRNTMRYLLGSVNDFDPAVHAVPYDDLPSMDKHILGKLSAAVKEVEAAYETYQFQRANQALITFASSDLSSFYLDIAKDRLYISSQTEFRRRSCQTVIATVLEQMTVIMAPLVPHMAEEVWQSLPYKIPAESVFQNGWVGDSKLFPTHEDVMWNKLRLLRSDVNKRIEDARRAKDVGASMECGVRLHASDPADAAMLRSLLKGEAFGPQKDSESNKIDDLRFILMVSQVEIVSSLDELKAQCPTYSTDAADAESGISVGVMKATGKKCDRCWYYDDNVGEDHEHSDICLRCAEVVTIDKYVVEPAVEHASV